MAKEIMLHAVGIDKQFGPTHAVDHVSLDFYKGEIHALIGENGSGKSTFTNMLTGIISIGEGTFEGSCGVFAQCLFRHKRRDAMAIGFLIV